MFKKSKAWYVARLIQAVEFCIIYLVFFTAIKIITGSGLISFFVLLGPHILLNMLKGYLKYCLKRTGEWEDINL